jgi:hypothetical protein
LGEKFDDRVADVVIALRCSSFEQFGDFAEVQDAVLQVGYRVVFLGHLHIVEAHSRLDIFSKHSTRAQVLHDVLVALRRHDENDRLARDGLWPIVGVHDETRLHKREVHSLMQSLTTALLFQLCQCHAVAFTCVFKVVVEVPLKVLEGYVILREDHLRRRYESVVVPAQVRLSAVLFIVDDLDHLFAPLRLLVSRELDQFFLDLISAFRLALVFDLLNNLRIFC